MCFQDGRSRAFTDGRCCVAVRCSVLWFIVVWCGSVRCGVRRHRRLLWWLPAAELKAEAAST